jgi:Mg-chelatase subunit ChlD
MSNLRRQEKNVFQKPADSIVRKASSITFLLDVSNSMGQDNKMALLKKSTATATNINGGLYEAYEIAL